MSKDEGGGKSGFQFFFKILGETIKLDAWDLNFFFSDPEALEWSILDIESRKIRYHKGFIPQTIIFFGRFIRCLFRFMKWQHTGLQIESPIVFFGLTKNQIDSLEPLFRDIKDHSILIDGRSNSGWDFIQLLGYFTSFFFLPIAFLNYFGSKSTYRKGIQHNFAFHWYTFGLFFVIRYYLHWSRIKGIVLSNDHVMENRLVIKAAKDEKITTFYLQHASVTRCFPPLSMDYALLDGIDALMYYEAAGKSNTTSFLTGSPKFDKYYFYINRHSRAKSIGICQNLYDRVTMVDQLCAELRSRFSTIQISLRIHPREANRAVWVDLAKKYKMKYSDSLSEGIYEYLQSVDVIIAGNSNVHLEATLLNVYSIFYDFSTDKRHQYYSFIQNGLCEKLENSIAVCDRVDNLIKSKPDTRLYAKRYVDTIDTSFDGQSTNLALRVIHETIFQGFVDMSIWQPVPKTSLNAFRLRKADINTNLIEVDS
jgi:hypothetical protein